MSKFTVDTHLFRELGELLVGRDSTALVELIKNSYDADATTVVVYAEAIEDTARGFIRITDNGTGMTPDEFRLGFLRIASRSKEATSSSPVFHRRYTGAKGIGRLAAHKLARVLDVISTPSPVPERPQPAAIEARIDWAAIEKYETFDDLEGTDAIQLVERPISPSMSPGTLITLRSLRKPWTDTARSQFLAEVQTFEPPRVLCSPLPPSVLSSSLLFEQPHVRDTQSGSPQFRVVLEGDFGTGEDYWQALADTANWVVEIDTTKGDAKVHYAIAPTVRTSRQNPLATGGTYSIDHPDEQGPFFQARILVREGRVTGPTLPRAWLDGSSGVRVYMEGFRVLPYGEPKNDWLSLDADYTRRRRALRSLEPLPPGLTSEDRDAGLVILPNSAYFGAAFLTVRQAPSLKMLVNREGFVPETGLNALTELVRIGIDLCTRTRASARLHLREKRRQDRSPQSASSNTSSIDAAVKSAAGLVKKARQLTASGSWTDAAKATEAAIDEIQRAFPAFARLISERSLLRVVASIGTQMAEFVHEMNSLVAMVESIDTALAKIRSDDRLPRILRPQLSRVLGLFVDLRRGLEKQAAYLLDVFKPDARRRRSRESLSQRFEAAFRLVQVAAEQKHIGVQNRIPRNLLSPPMFPSELIAIFSNLLTNALKAAGNHGRIRALGMKRRDGSTRIVVENTGKAVDPKQGERWFRPFESTTASVDPILGQGMGLGLPITRTLLEEYGASIRFIRPSRGFSTALEITFPR